MKRIVSIMLLIATINCFTMEETPENFSKTTINLKSTKSQPLHLNCKYVLFSDQKNYGLGVYDTKTGKYISTIKDVPTDHCKKYKISPNNNFLATIFLRGNDGDTSLFVCEVKTGKTLWYKIFPKTWEDRKSILQFSPDEETLYVQINQDLLSFDTKNGELLKRKKLTRQPPSPLALRIIGKKVELAGDIMETQINGIDTLPIEELFKMRTKLIKELRKTEKGKLVGDIIETQINDIAKLPIKQFRKIVTQLKQKVIRETEKQIVKKLELYNKNTKEPIWETNLPPVEFSRRVDSRFPSLQSYTLNLQGEYISAFFKFSSDIMPYSTEYIFQVYDIKTGELKVTYRRNNEQNERYSLRSLLYLKFKKIGQQNYLAMGKKTSRDTCNLHLYDLQTGKPVWKDPIKHVKIFDFCTDKNGTTQLLAVTQASGKNFEIQTYTFPKEKEWQKEDPKERVSFTKEMLLEEKPEDVDLRGFGLPGFGPAGIKFVPKKQTTRKAPPVPPVRPKKTYEKKTITKRTKGPKQLLARITGQRGMKYTVKTEDGKKFECFIPKKFRNIKRSDIEKLHIKPSGRHNQATIIKVFKKQ